MAAPYTRADSERGEQIKYAANSQCWALGRQQRNGFHVRKIVWGRLMARMEKREGEEIRRASIFVKGEQSR